MGGILEIQNPARASVALAALFPDGVVASELLMPGEVSLLYPEEQQCIDRMVPKRAQEFAAGRLCARQVLAQLGVTGTPVLVAADRQPLWPSGIVGSITHTAQYCAAVASRASRFMGLGLDTERAEALQEHLWPQICTNAEIQELQALPETHRARAAALIFSAKEAFYKAQYPLTGEWLEFHDVEVYSRHWLRECASFELRPRRSMRLAQQGLSAMRGRFRYHEQFVTTAVALTRVLIAGSSRKT